MIPTRISLAQKDELNLVWSDGKETRISLKILRDNCPCASCQGETVLLKTYKPAPQPDLPGKYMVKGAEQVGSYALQIRWGDGHQTGIYTWDRLMSLSEPASE